MACICGHGSKCEVRKSRCIGMRSMWVALKDEHWWRRRIRVLRVELLSRVVAYAGTSAVASSRGHPLSTCARFKIQDAEIPDQGWVRWHPSICKSIDISSVS